MTLRPASAYPHVSLDTTIEEIHFFLQERSLSYLVSLLKIGYTLFGFLVSLYGDRLESQYSTTPHGSAFPAFLSLLSFELHARSPRSFLKPRIHKFFSYGLRFVPTILSSEVPNKSCI